MIGRKEINRLRQRLKIRREQILDFRKAVDRSWKDLQEPEVESEETAEKQKLAQSLDQLDEQEKDQVESVDRALHKIETGSYGVCETCGADIARKRLEAVPWARYCRKCSTGQETETAEGEVHRTGVIPPAFQGMGDEEIRKAVTEELVSAKRMDLQELHIEVMDGVIYLEGFLPSEAEREILMEMVQDTLGFHDVVDRTGINRLLWEKKDRRPPPQAGGKSDEEVILQGEDTDQESFHSSKSGKPLSPPDRMEPESGEE
jgi:DnaK suppressor protein